MPPSPSLARDPGSLANALRESTRAEHEYVEAALQLGDAQLDRVGYIHALTSLRRFVVAWERAVRPEPALAWGPWLPRRQWLEADLLALGVDEACHVEPAETLRLPSPVVLAELGAHYVLEGSALGAATVVHSLGRRFPATYFEALSRSAATRWRAFQRSLQAVDPTDHRWVIAGARATFSTLVTGIRAARDGKC